MMRREDQRFPGRALLPFAVRRQADYVRIRAAQLERERSPGSERQTVTEATGREADISNSTRRRMSCEERVVLVKGPQVLVGKSSDTPEDGVKRSRTVPFRQHETVAFA